MNAHERLRLYLEQRRELGESELVLDALPVDAVLKMIGAPGGKGTTSKTASAAPSVAPTESTPRSSAGERAATSDAPPLDVSTPSANDAPPVASGTPPTDPAPRFNSTATTDWRAALSDLAPGAEQKAAQRASNASSQPASGNAAASDGSKTDATRQATNAENKTADAPQSNAASVANFPAWLANLGIPVGLSAGAPADSSTTPAANACNTLDELAAVIASCRACALGASAINPVPGEGNSHADFVCVGEAPGQTEDETGRPFIGAAGDLLTKILAAIQLPREEVFICNVLKHRPPGNRNPALDEIHVCTPYLTRQLALIQPKVILALGTFAAQTLLNTTTSLGKLRGQVHRYNGVPLIVTYHPAALLRNENWKRPTWDDVKLARKILDAARVEATRAASPAS